MEAIIWTINTFFKGVAAGKESIEVSKATVYANLDSMEEVNAKIQEKAINVYKTVKEEIKTGKKGVKEVVKKEVVKKETLRDMINRSK